jgi:hypothetical protein
MARVVLPKSDQTRRAHPDAPAATGSVVRPKWYSSSYLAQVFARRPAQVLALVAFVAIAAILIYVFAAGSETFNLTLSGGTLNNTVYNSGNNTVSLSTSSGTHGLCTGGTAAPAVWDHVIEILFENKGYSAVIGSSAASSAPYINNTLVGNCTILPRYMDVVPNNSLPNYMVLTSGVPTPAADCSFSSSCENTGTSIYNQILSAGKTAKEYAESMPGNCARSNSGPYAERHNPETFYTNTTVHNDCLQNNVPIPVSTFTSGALFNDLQNPSSFPNFAFVTPNLCNDMHSSGKDGCPTENEVATGDTWLSRAIPMIVNSPTYRNSNTAILVLFDEGTLGSPIPNIAVSPYTSHSAPTSPTVNHYCTLFMAEDMLGLSHLPITPSSSCTAATATQERSAYGL